jgi:hypothetical protein
LNPYPLHPYHLPAQPPLPHHQLPHSPPPTNTTP